MVAGALRGAGCVQETMAKSDVIHKGNHADGDVDSVQRSYR